MSKAYIGTSGFMYPHWRGHFYPSKLPQRDWFGYYSKQFDTVELNVSFYCLPKKEVFEKWRKSAGKSFVFAIKGSRYITHIKRLKDCQEAVERFFEAADGLRRSAEVGWRISESSNASVPAGYGLPAGRPSEDIASRQPSPRFRDVVLWQLPPRFKTNPERLKEFLKILPSLWRHAFEFRHESWLDKEVFQILKKYNAAIVFQDFPDWPRTTDYAELIGRYELGKLPFIYYRFHGVKALYTSGYSDKELKEIAVEIRRWLDKRKDVYAYFNNDALGYAVENAKTLEALVHNA
jgi:uncharacterized protein YecE (DUF72 family)